MLSLQSKTNEKWLEKALSDVDSILIDHTHCEHKATIMALAFVSKYPDDSDILAKCSALAVEEAEHMQQMIAVCNQRQLALGHPGRDEYVQKLLKLTRPGKLEHRIDRLLIAGIIEARSCERLKLLAENLPDEKLRALYDVFWRQEAGHHVMFVELAEGSLIKFAEKSPIEARTMIKTRLDELMHQEVSILDELPIRAAIH